MSNKKKPEEETGCCQVLEDFLSPKFFKALSDPNRLQILALLTQKTKPSTVSEVSSCCPVDVSVVSRHLGTLRDAGILEAEKQGKEVRYRVLTGKLVSTLRNLADAIEACCPNGDCYFDTNKGEKNE